MKSLKNLLSSLLLLLPFHAAIACGISYMGEDYRVALLNPYVIGSDHWQFFYSANLLNGYTNNQQGSDRDRNCGEWAAQFGKDVAPSDVYEFLYPTSLDDVLNAVAEGNANERFGANPFFKALLRPENKPILDYLIFSKKYEHYSNLPERDPWSSNRWDKNYEAAEQGKKELKANAIVLLHTLKDPWLRRRYAYQLMLMHRYDGEKAAFQKIYDEYFDNDRSTVLSDWALHHLAALTTDKVLANYRYALSFDRNPEKELSSYKNFSTKYFDATMALAQNDHERALLLVLFELKNPGRSLANLQKIYTLDTGNKFLPLLLVREVSKLEDWLLTDDVTGMGTAHRPDLNEEDMWEWNDDQWAQYRKINAEKDRAYLTEVRTFFEKMANDDLTHLLTAHLYSLEKNAAQASRHLAAISQPSRPEIAEQKAVEQLLIQLNSKDITDPKVKAELATHLLALQKRQDSYPSGKRDFQALNLVLANAFLQKGDLATAYFFELNASNIPHTGNAGYESSYYRLISFLDWQATEQDIDKVLVLIEKPNKTAFERYLCSAQLPSRNALLDLRGTISFRKNDLPEALSAFSKVESDFWKNKYEFNHYLDSDPFAIFRDSIHKGNFPPTKTAFVKRLMNLEEEAKANPAKAAENYLLLGKAWLNCSYRGNSWMMFAYGQSVQENGDSWHHFVHTPNSEEMKAVYYHQKRALDYLAKTRVAAPTDSELMAQLAFLQARMDWWHRDVVAEDATVWQLEWQERNKFLKDQEMTFYKKWVEEGYEDTDFWQEVQVTCPGLMAYFGK